MSPTVTWSSAAGMVPTLYWVSTWRKSRWNSSVVMGSSPSSSHELIQRLAEDLPELGALLRPLQKARPGKACPLLLQGLL